MARSVVCWLNFLGIGALLMAQPFSQPAAVLFNYITISHCLTAASTLASAPEPSLSQTPSLNCRNCHCFFLPSHLAIPWFLYLVWAAVNWSISLSANSLFYGPVAEVYMVNKRSGWAVQFAVVHFVWPNIFRCIRLKCLWFGTNSSCLFLRMRSFLFEFYFPSLNFFPRLDWRKTLLAVWNATLLNVVFIFEN